MDRSNQKLETNEFSMLQEEYSLEKITYVNSANHAHSEIELHGHLVMFGRNNSGKTASLAGSKLLLFPETDFFKCEKKFRFEGKEGLYSMEDSYEFYFPDAKSFIILEVNNPEGRFCMILHKTSNYGYARYFVPGAYSDIRYLFWNSEEASFSEDLGVSTVAQYVKANNGIQVNDVKELTYIMFSSFRDSRENKRFCVLPLKDDRPDAIAAFMNIYHLAFDSATTGTKSLPKALATLLEMGRGRDEERLDANLNQLNEERARLLNKQDWITKLRNNKHFFDQAQASHVKIKVDYESYSREFKSLESILVKLKSEHAPRYNAALERKVAAENNKKSLQENLRNTIGTLRQKEGALESLEGGLKAQKAVLVKTKQMISGYGGMSERDIVDSLNEYIGKQQEALDQYRVEGGIQKALQANIQEKNRLLSNLDKVEKLINGSSSSSLFKLKDDNAASILLSINNSFSNITSDIDQGSRDAIITFSKLFEQTDLGLNFLGELLTENKKDYDVKGLIVQWTKQKDDIDRSIRKLSKSIDEQQQALKHGDLDQLIKRTENEIKKANSDVIDIQGVGSSIKNIEDNQRRIDEVSDEITSLKLEEQSIRNKSSEALSKYGFAESELNSLIEQRDDFSKIDDHLTQAKKVCMPTSDDLEILDAGEQTFSVQQSINLERTATSLSRQLAEFSNTLSSLLIEIPLPSNAIDLHKNYVDLKDHTVIINEYDNIYATIDYDETQLSNEIISHNQVVNNQLNEMKEAKTLLSNFISVINDELNSKTISNLSQIKLHLELNKKFESLLDTLGKHDIQDDSLLEESFYQMLARFVEEHFNKKTRRLKMHDLIDSVQYHYTLSDTGEVVTKSQSGGTTSAINAFVLSVLLKRVTPPYVALNMPIIVDEIGTLDIINAGATITQIADHGFSIFCATPSFSASVARDVGRWIMIDKFRVKTPIVKHCIMNIMPGEVESFGEKSYEAS